MATNIDIKQKIQEIDQTYSEVKDKNQYALEKMESEIDQLRKKISNEEWTTGDKFVDSIVVYHGTTNLEKTIEFYDNLKNGFQGYDGQLALVIRKRDVSMGTGGPFKDKKIPQIDIKMGIIKYEDYEQELDKRNCEYFLPIFNYAYSDNGHWPTFIEEQLSIDPYSLVRNENETEIKIGDDEVKKWFSEWFQFKSINKNLEITFGEMAQMIGWSLDNWPEIEIAIDEERQRFIQETKDNFLPCIKNLNPRELIRGINILKIPIDTVFVTYGDIINQRGIKQSST